VFQLFFQQKSDVSDKNEEVPVPSSAVKSREPRVAEQESDEPEKASRRPEDEFAGPEAASKIIKFRKRRSLVQVMRGENFSTY
jgi:hypothetical protein